ncbi:MAG: DUF333 domain-containing protein [Nanoarchaeota archaeon]|nr:DUF333 domain-containing protein [Nanoarchaeota archaeon]
MECPDGSYVIRVGPDCEFEKCPVGMANPASVYCVKRGGSLEIIDEPEGQVGYCTLPDGTVCEEWAYFRGECGSSEGPICGNGICEEGEGSSGQDCKLGYDCEAMYRGTCPEDCGMGIVTIEIPSKFSLTLGQSARIGVYHMTLTSVMQSDQMVCQSLNCPKPKQMAVLTLSIKRPYLRGAEAGNEGVQETVEVSEPGSSGSAGEMSKPTVGIRREDALPPTNIRAIDPERKVLSVGESFVYGGAKITLAGVSGNEARFTAEKSACDCTKEKCAECTAEAPICRIDTGVQGWYLGDELISKANCICTAICKLEGTRSEGFYSSCDGSLIKYEQCKFTRRYWEDVKVKPIEGGGYQVTSNATATSLRRVFVENGVVTVETDNGTAEIKFLPEEAAAIARENKRFVEIRKIEIDTKDGVPVYKVRGTVDSRFLWIFPITREEDVTVNAQTSEVIN